MEEEPKVRLKFKKIAIFEGGLMPNRYRLATVEEIRNNLPTFRKWGLPIKTIRSSSGNLRDRNICLLGGWMTPHFNAANFQLHEARSEQRGWNAVVKEKERVNGKWRNKASDKQRDLNNLNLFLFQCFICYFIHHSEFPFISFRQSHLMQCDITALYSFDGISLRKQLYHGITLSPQGITAAWVQACFYEDVELLYWLWETTTPPIESIGISFLPLKEMVSRLRLSQSGWPLQLENAMQEAHTILAYVYDPLRSDEEIPVIELFIEIYGASFVDAATAITFRNVEESIPTAVTFRNVKESIPIFTKLLSLSLHHLQDQIPNIKPLFTEVLIEAIKRGYRPLVEKLWELQDDIAQITTDNCVKALREAVRTGYLNLVQSFLDLLSRRDEINLPVEVDEEGKTLFYYALPHADVFQLLEKTYNNDNIMRKQDKFGRNILQWAAKAKGTYSTQVLDHLLQSFPEVLIHSTDDQGQTPWHTAASKGDIQMMDKLLNLSGFDCLREIDPSGRTALHLAAGEGREDTVRMLIHEGSDPLKERDVQRKTALHHAAQAKNPKAALATCQLLLQKCGSSSKQSLLLWASAAGIGTADEMEDAHPSVKRYLKSQKEAFKDDLLRAAAINNYVEMAWELLNRGADMGNILDKKWREELDSSEKASVDNVINQMERMKEQGRDQPSMEDKLGRHVFAEGLAALFLNRFIESPITVGISGEWGTGKSSLMIQTEKILLNTAAQLAFPNLLPFEDFGGAKKIILSARGKKIYQQIKRGVDKLLAPSKDKSEKENPLVNILDMYQPQYHAVYKSLACMNNNQMLQLDSQKSSSQKQEHALREVPRILTIRYNAWHYSDRYEAWAGLGVAVTKEIENAMTRAQWLSTCWTYTWGKHSVKIWLQVILPCLLSIFLAGWVAWIVWMLLKQAKFKGLQYGSIPFTVIAIVWVVLKSVISVVKPVSAQMMGYITSPEHSSHLGYQEEVIADINFLKKELGKKPHWFFSFILGQWCWSWFGLYADNVENTSIPKFMPASVDQIRIITFVDDLDRCEEKVILQVLSAINLVLAECKINVILGMDKKMIERAIKRNFEDTDDEDLAEKFMCKIIQIPLSLPDPTQQETHSFLEHHIGQKVSAKFTFEVEDHEDMRKQNTYYDSDPEEIEAHSHRAVLDIEQPPYIQQPRCEGIIPKAVEFVYAIAKKISRKLRQPSDSNDGNLHSLKSSEGVRLIREILLPNYTTEESDIIFQLTNFATGTQKFPREWKRFLSYHKFAWYVLSRRGKVYSLPPWKVELIAWIFVCWQWKHEMNLIIKDWQKYTVKSDTDQGKDRKQRIWRGPPLSEIIKNCEPKMRISDQSVVSQGSNTVERQEEFLKFRGSLRQDPSMKAILCLYNHKESIGEEGASQNRWLKLQEALKIQDVSMKGIQLFQQFRLHCETDHLPWIFNDHQST